MKSPMKRLAFKCDYPGCRNKPYREVYALHVAGRENAGWNYLCRRHFEQEKPKKRFDAWCSAERPARKNQNVHR